MHVLITGGAGYLGSALLPALQQCLPSGSRITVLDNLSRRGYQVFFDAAAAHPYPLDFRHEDLLNSRVLQEVVAHADIVYHLAARVHTPFAHEDPHGYAQVNHWGSAELSYALEESPVRHLIYLSSASVYGATQTPATPDTPARPETHYGITKLQGEEMLFRLKDRMQVSVVRAGNLFGYAPSMRVDAVVNKWMFEAIHRNKIQLEGGGDQLRSFVEVNRSARLLAALAAYTAPSAIYNLVDYVLSMKALSRHFEALFPGLEVIQTDQDVGMRSLTVAPSQVWSSLDGSPPPLPEALSDFRRAWQWPRK